MIALALALVVAAAPDSQLPPPRIGLVSGPTVLGGRAPITGRFLDGARVSVLLDAAPDEEILLPIVSATSTLVWFAVPPLVALEAGGAARVIVRTAAGADTSAVLLLIDRTPKLTRLDAGAWRVPSPSADGIAPPLPPRTARLIEVEGVNLDRAMWAAIGDFMLPAMAVVAASPFRVFIGVPDDCWASGRLTLHFDPVRKQPASARVPLIGPPVTCGAGGRLSSP